MLYPFQSATRMMAGIPQAVGNVYTAGENPRGCIALDQTQRYRLAMGIACSLCLDGKELVGRLNIVRGKMQSEHPPDTTEHKGARD